MKRTFKSFFCILLSVIMSFSALSVFAAAQGENFVWCDAEYYYAGEAKLGDNSFTVSEDSLCFDFNVENSGYYYVTMDYYQGTYSVGEVSVPLTYDEYTYEEKPCYYSYDVLEDNDLERYIFNLESGTEKFMFNLFPEGMEIEENSPLKFNIKYLGREVTDIVLKNGTDKDIILGYDLYDCWYEDYCYDDYMYCYKLRCDFDLVFDNQEKLEFAESELTLGTDYEVGYGENEVNNIFFEYDNKLTITVNSVSDYIESVEVTGLDDCYCKRFYDGCYTGEYGMTDETAITVTYKDGSKKKFDGDTVTLVEGGKEYYWGLAFHYEDNEACMDILVADELVGSAPCELIYASYDENLSHLIFNINDRVFWIKAMVREKFAEIAYAETAWDYFTAVRDAFIYAGDSVVYIFQGIMAEIGAFRAAV